jgi:hypothetical protein
VPVPALVAVAAKTRAAAGEVRTASRHWRALLAGTLVCAAVVAAPVGIVLIAVGGTPDAEATGSPGTPIADIPAEALAAYQHAADTWDTDWAILAAIGKVECDHGRSRLPGCIPDTMNRAGARGYMQFIGSTWRAGLGQHQLEPRTSTPAPDGSGYATDGDGDGDADPWSWPDAAHSAARYLAANGLNHNPHQAVWRYNHSNTYVARVLELAATYRDAASRGQSYADTAGDVPLATVTCPAGGSTIVHAQLAATVGAMYEAGAADGIHLCGSGYRDGQRQIDLRRAHCGTSRYAIYQMPPSQCSPPTARPGTSRHESGLAIDLTCDAVLIRHRQNVCYRWLATNASRYGFYELATGQEAWHWSTDAR